MSQGWLAQQLKTRNRIMAKTTKTAQEIVAEAKARLIAAEAKVAREAAKGNPIVTELNQIMEGLNGEINANSRLLNGPNSFENRLNAAQLRASWIEAQKNLVEKQDNLLRARKDALQHRINAICEEIATNEDGNLMLESVDSVLENLPNNDFADLVQAEAEAKDAWKASTPEAIRKAQQEAKQPNNNEASA